MPSAGLLPHRKAMHKQHTEPGPSCCVPFSDPHVNKVTPSGETRQECSHSNANTLGHSTMWRGHTRPTTSPKEGKEGGTSTKGSVLILTCVPLPHLVLPLSGCLSRRTPARATRGEARGHRSALAQNPLLMYPLLFPFFELVVDLVCPFYMVDWHQCARTAVAAFLPGFARWLYFVGMRVAEGHTARWPWLCVLFVHRLAVWV